MCLPPGGNTFSGLALSCRTHCPPLSTLPLDSAWAHRGTSFWLDSSRVSQDWMHPGAPPNRVGVPSSWAVWPHLPHRAWASGPPPCRALSHEAGIRWAVPRLDGALLPAQARLRPPHLRIGEARRPGPSGPIQARILVANATSLEASWPAIRLERWDCLLVQESRLPALSWLRTEVRKNGWRYLSGTIGGDGRDLVAIIIKTGGCPS